PHVREAGRADHAPRHAHPRLPVAAGHRRLDVDHGDERAARPQLRPQRQCRRHVLHRHQRLHDRHRSRADQQPGADRRLRQRQRRQRRQRTVAREHPKPGAGGRQHDRHGLLAAGHPDRFGHPAGAAGYGHGEPADRVDRRPPPVGLGRLARRGDDEPGQVPARLSGLGPGDECDGRDDRPADLANREGGAVRITQNMLSRNLLSDLQGDMDKLSATQQKLSSGKELTQPSDDPFGTSRALQYRADLAQNQQYQRNVDEANSWQSVTDTALSKISDSLLRVRDLVVQGANDTSGQSARSDIAAEITQLIDSIKAEGNTQYAGRYVFAGSATTTQPYQMGASDTYSGNAEVMKREIGPNVRIDLNQTGITVLGDTNSGLLKTLRTVVADLQANNGAALQN